MRKIYRDGNNNGENRRLTKIYIDTGKKEYVLVHPRFIALKYPSGSVGITRGPDPIENYFSYIARIGLKGEGRRLKLDEDKLRKAGILTLCLPPDLRNTEELISSRRTVEEGRLGYHLFALLKPVERVLSDR